MTERKDELFAEVRIPNGEVRSEFMKIIAGGANVESRDLQRKGEVNRL